GRVAVGLGREQQRRARPGHRRAGGPHPTEGTGLTGVTQLAAAAEISMALRSDGTLLVWGYEGFGLRGDGIPRSTPLPVPTPVTPGPGVTKIAPSGSTVLVRPPVVTMPNVVGELRASAVGHLQAIGLSVQVSTVPDPDRRCDHV